MNWALIGYGGMGRWHVRTLQSMPEHFTICGIYDIDEEKRIQAEKDGLQLLAVPETTELSTLGGATVRVLASDGSLLAELPVFWQEVTHGT